MYYILTSITAGAGNVTSTYVTPCTLVTVTVRTKNSPGEPYSWRGRRQILGMTSISVFTYCSMVPCSCKVAKKIDGTEQGKVEERAQRRNKIIHFKDAAHRGEWKHAFRDAMTNEDKYQALDNLKQLLHHYSNALVT